MNKFFIILCYIAIALTSSCSFFKEKTCDYEKIPLNLENVEPLSLRQVEWIIITPENSEEKFKELKEKEIDQVIMGLTDNGYESLSLNFNEVIQLIEKLKQQNLDYKKYYEQPAD